VIEKFYQPARKPKALAVSAQGQQGFYINQTSADEAVRRALETCGSRAGVACMIVAVDDVFIVPMPTIMKVVEFFHPGSNATIAVEEREELARRLGNAPGGWNAVAVGADGRPGLALKAASEQIATDGALAECGRLDRRTRLTPTRTRTGHVARYRRRVPTTCTTRCADLGRQKIRTNATGSPPPMLSATMRWLVKCGSIEA
jgi:hypothetical protein